jgi:anti-anti-sigma factor
MSSIELAQPRETTGVIALVEASDAGLLLTGEMLAKLSHKGLRVAGERHENRLVLRLEGRLDGATTRLLKQAFEANTQALHLDLDLAACPRADGVGLATLVRIATLVSGRGGALRVVNLPPALRGIVARINLHHLIDIAESAPPPVVQ